MWVAQLSCIHELILKHNYTNGTVNKQIIVNSITSQEEQEWSTVTQSLPYNILRTSYQVSVVSVAETMSNSTVCHPNFNSN